MSHQANVPTGPLSVRKVESASDLKAFVEFPWTVYKGDPKWVPPLLSQRKALLDRKKNPGWDYMEGDLFVAYRGSQPVGTVSAVINHNHNKFWNENIGWFGFFECFNDQEVANALLQTATDHVKKLGATEGMRGPASFSLYDEFGLLIEGFERPVILMPYTQPYYPALVENSGMGFTKSMDFFSWYTNKDRMMEGGQPLPKLARVVEKTKNRNGITLRAPDPRKLREEVGVLQRLWDECWEKNWGFYPLTNREADKLFHDLKDFVDVNLARFAVKDGKDVGFVLGLPDLNQALHFAYPRPGVPEIWSLLKVLWFWKIRRKVHGLRVILLGVEPELRARGIEAALNLEFLQSAVGAGYYDADFGWVLEVNQPMNGLAQAFKADLYRRYRLYQRPL